MSEHRGSAASAAPWALAHRLRRVPLLAWLFVLIAVPVLSWQVVWAPTGEVPDEVAHIARAASLMEGALIGHRRAATDKLGQPSREAGVPANIGLISAGFTFIPGSPPATRKMTAERLAQLRSIPWAPAPVFAAVPNTATYAPLFYIPAGAAMATARIMGAQPYNAVLVARGTNAALYVALGLAALLLGGRLRPVLFATLVLPMSLWMAGTINQDGLLIGCACLAAAALLRATPSRRRYWWIGGTSLALVLLAKPLYLPLAATMLVAGGGVPPLADRRAWLNRLALAVAVGLPALLWYALASAVATVPFVRGEPYPAGPLWPGAAGQIFAAAEPGANLHVLLSRPSLFLTLPLASMRAEYDMKLAEMVGVLGALNIIMPDWVYRVWGVGLVAAVLASAPGARRVAAARQWPATALLGAAIVLAMLAIYIGQYLSWTHVGSAQVEGVQGRYFIPLLPFLALALPPAGAAAATLLRGIGLPLVAAAAVLGGFMVPTLTLLTYYLH